MVRYKVAVVFLLLLMFTGFSRVAQAQTSICPGQNAQLRPMTTGFQQLPVSSTPVSLTVPKGAEMAIASLETADVRYRDDGTLPTASIGVLLPVGSAFIVCVSSLDRVRFIASSANATLNVGYYGR